MVFGMPRQAEPMIGLPVGSLAPAFSGIGLNHETISLDALQALGKPIVLIFTNPTCGPCTALMPEVGRWQQDYAGRLTVALISRGSIEANRAKVSEYHLTHLILQHQSEIDDLYEAQATPSAVLIHPDGLIESPLVEGSESIRALVTRAVSLRHLPLLPLIQPNRNCEAEPEPISGAIGSPAPAFSLPDLRGEPVSLSSFLGEPTLLLFWNPNCGFCRRMIPDLQAWEANPPLEAPRLLIISRGTVKENREMGLRSPILLNQKDDVGEQFGMDGTPMAILIDAQGRIASSPVGGATDVLALAGPVKDVAQSSLS
jgi:thiol-disulfide isomerase/thioredoxin